MNFLKRLFGGTTPATKVDNAAEKIDRGQQDQALEDLHKLIEASREAEDGKEPDPDVLARAWLLIARIQKNRGNDQEALEAYKNASQIDGQSRLDETLQEGFSFISDQRVFSEDAEPLLRRYREHFPDNNRGLLNLAKVLVQKDELDDDSLEVIERAAEHFPMWKGGNDVIFSRYLDQERTDEDAVQVYRSAYSNHPDDEKLRQTYRDALVENEVTEEFALDFYQDWLEENEDHEVLELYANATIRKDRLSETTAPFIKEALQHGLLEENLLKKLADTVLSETRDYLPKRVWAPLLYEAGLHSGRLIGEYAESLVEQERFDDDSIAIYEAALEHHDLSRRAVLLLGEHLKMQDDSSDFAAKVFEEFIDYFPDRADDKIYLLLAKSYVSNSRVDEEAREVYQRALKVDPSHPQIIKLLAHSFAQNWETGEEAMDIYERAYVQLDDEPFKEELADLLIQQRVEDGLYDQKTLRYIDYHLPNKEGEEAHELVLSQARCFLNLEFADEEAKEAYLTLYEDLGEDATSHPRLIRVLAHIFLTEDADPDRDPTVREIYDLAFEIDKFDCEPDIAFKLLPEYLAEDPEGKTTLNLTVRAFEADSEQLVDTLDEHGGLGLLTELTSFYMNRYNFEQAARSARTAYRHVPSARNRFRLAKVLLLEDEPEKAREHLNELDESSLSAEVTYWSAVTSLYLDEPQEALSKLESALQDGLDISPALLEIRRGNAFELQGDIQGAREHYRRAEEEEGSEQYTRWLEIQLGVLELKEGDMDEAEQVFRRALDKNPHGRAENRFLMLSQLMRAGERMEAGETEAALEELEVEEFSTTAPDLAELGTQLLWNYGEPAFFEGNYQLAVQIFEAARGLDSGEIRNRYFLALAYHLLERYQTALLHYTEIEWGRHPTELERGQALCYLEADKPDKSWKVFVDLMQRDAIHEEDYPLFYRAFLEDPDARDGERLEDVELPDDGLIPAAIYLRDGCNEKAQQRLEKLQKEKDDDPYLLWYLGQLYSRLDQKDMAMHYWRELVDIAVELDEFAERRNDVLLEVGLAFLNAGYAQEAMDVWEQLRQQEMEPERLAKLYAQTLNLHAFQLARKDQMSVAEEEWKKALQYDSNNPKILQNLAVAQMANGDLQEALQNFRKVRDHWKKRLGRLEGQAHRELAEKVDLLEKSITDFSRIEELDPHNMERINLEDKLKIARRVNRMYAIMGLDKTVPVSRIEDEYFRLIKIFNPERHADDFMLIEDAYENLTDPQNRRKLDLFAFNPVSVEDLRNVVSDEGSTGIFEVKPPIEDIPRPETGFLSSEAEPIEKIHADFQNKLGINLNLGDWAVV